MCICMAQYMYIGQEFVGKKLPAPWGGQKEKKNDVGGSQSPHTLFMHLVISFLPSNPQLLKGLHFPDSSKFTGEFCKKLRMILYHFYNVFLENHSRESYQSHFMRSAYPNIKLTHKIGKFHGGHKHEQNSL